MTREKRCPHCSADWQHVSERASQLSDAGYLHEDVTHLCTECGNTWTHGRPEGETANEALRCPVCEDWLLAHKFHGGDVEATSLQYKCPTCYYWTDDVELLQLDNGEVALGYPQITGSLEGDHA